MFRAQYAKFRSSNAKSYQEFHLQKMFWSSTPGGIYKRSIDLRKSLPTHFNAMSKHRGDGEKEKKETRKAKMVKSSF